MVTYIPEPAMYQKDLFTRYSMVKVTPTTQATKFT
jgi:hypothetical protein